jgi:hypothetical protein
MVMTRGEISAAAAGQCLEIRFEEKLKCCFQISGREARKVSAESSINTVKKETYV